MREALILSICCFTLGAIPFGLLLGKLKGVDIRKSGSGNIGATNAGRVLGKKLGILTLVLDIGKGAGAVLLARWLQRPDLAGLAAIAAIMGHCFTPFLNFKGGKGVATTLGAFATLAPFAALLTIAIFALTLGATRYVSLASIVGALSFPLLLLIGVPERMPEELVLPALLAAVLILARHWGNLQRIRQGQEPKAFSSRQA